MKYSQVKKTIKNIKVGQKIQQWTLAVECIIHPSYNKMYKLSCSYGEIDRLFTLDECVNKIFQYINSTECICENDGYENRKYLKSKSGKKLYLNV